MNINVAFQLTCETVMSPFSKFMKVGIKQSYTKRNDRVTGVD